MTEWSLQAPHSPSPAGGIPAREQHPTQGVVREGKRLLGRLLKKDEREPRMAETQEEPELIAVI